LAEQTGLVEAIDRRLHLLKIHRPYHESDHVLNLAYNAMCDGVRLEDIELRRNDEVFLDALGTQRIPDPTTAGDFCRRFAETDIRALMAAIDDARLKVWARPPPRVRDAPVGAGRPSWSAKTTPSSSTSPASAIGRIAWSCFAKPLRTRKVKSDCSQRSATSSTSPTTGRSTRRT
jgi:hypothetical protein